MIGPTRQLPPPDLPADELGAPAESPPAESPAVEVTLEDAKRDLLAYAHAPRTPNVIQRHPWRAVLAGLLAGVVLGRVPAARTGAVVVLKQFWPQVVRALVAR